MSVPTRRWPPTPPRSPPAARSAGHAVRQVALVSRRRPRARRPGPRPGQRGRLRRQPATLPALSTQPDRVSEGATARSCSRLQRLRDDRSLFSATRPHSVADRRTIPPRLRQHADRRGTRCSACWPILVPQRRLVGGRYSSVASGAHRAGSSVGTYPCGELAREPTSATGWRRLLPETGSRVRRLRPRERLRRRPCGPARWRRPSRRRRIRSRRRCPNAV
jgi:hypothetical protein